MAKKAKFTKIEKIVKELPDEKRQLAEDVLKRLVFTSNTLDELQKQIETEGAVIKAKNGNGFEVISEHPAHRAFVALVSKYNPLCKTLAEWNDGSPKIEGWDFDTTAVQDTEYYVNTDKRDKDGFKDYNYFKKYQVYNIPVGVSYLYAFNAKGTAEFTPRFTDISEG